MWENPRVKFLGFDEPINNTSWGVWGTKMQWRGHHGVGDYLYGLNVAYYLSFVLQQTIDLEFVWDYDRNYYWAHDDHETIFERGEYLHSFYYEYGKRVNVEHIYNSPDVNSIFKGEMSNFVRYGYPNDGAPAKQGSSNMRTIHADICHWKFRDEIDSTPEKNKVVIWTPFSNSTRASEWKYKWTEWDWEIITDLLLEQNYNIHQLDYRTPVREAFYAIRKAEFVIAYDGMWQYISRNLLKPAIMIGNNGIVQSHSPQAQVFFSRDRDKNRKPPIDFLHTFVRDLREKNLKHLIDKRDEYKKKLESVICNEN